MRCLPKSGVWIKIKRQNTGIEISAIVAKNYLSIFIETHFKSQGHAKTCNYCPYPAHVGYLLKSQVLISLRVGDKLNTGKIEFGLNGGFNLTSFRGISEAKGQNNWALGFYFDFITKEKSPWYIVTGFMLNQMSEEQMFPLITQETV